MHHTQVEHNIMGILLIFLYINKGKTLDDTTSPSELTGSWFFVCSFTSRKACAVWCDDFFSCVNFICSVLHCAIYCRAAIFVFSFFVVETIIDKILISLVFRTKSVSLHDDYFKPSSCVNRTLHCFSFSSVYEGFSLV